MGIDFGFDWFGVIKWFGATEEQEKEKRLFHIGAIIRR
jgi:hypothetical protein